MKRMFTHASPSLDLVEKFFSGTGASYDAMVHYLTLGIDAPRDIRIVRGELEPLAEAPVQRGPSAPLTNGAHLGEGFRPVNDRAAGWLD